MIASELREIGPIFEGTVEELGRLEIIGTLVAGVVHDFGNLLSVLHMYAKTMQSHLGDPEQLTQDLADILEVVAEGESVVRQLLTFAARNESIFASSNVNAIATTVVKLLTHVFPKTITIALELQPELPFVRADPNRLKQVLLNLCVNAKDAMANTGTLRLSTVAVTGAMLRARFREAQAESYVCISVADTGPGMDESIRQRVFEPFFTTKQGSRGTGLGLSTAHEIIKTHEGFIDVESQPGEGSTFHIYLPRERLPRRGKKGISKAALTRHCNKRVVAAAHRAATS